jgi:uncharacterized protein
LIVAGIICGFVNTLAGCGGAIALTVLNFFVPINIANGTFRIPILFQNIFAVHEFKKYNVYDRDSFLPVIIPMGIGGVFGAILAVYMPHGGLKLIIGIIMLVFFVLQVKKLLKKKQKEVEEIELLNKFAFFKYIAFFLVGFYGGFVQMGVGVISLIAIETFAKMDLFKANAIKMLGVLCYTVPVSIIFLLDGLIVFKLGFAMAVGNVIGAKIAVKSASKVDPKYIRVFLILILFLAGLYYIGVIKIFLP